MKEEIETVSDILIAWLQDHGYDGLYEEFGECACTLDELIPCGSDPSSCHPGYKRKPTPEEGNKFDFIIGPTKESTP